MESKFEHRNPSFRACDLTTSLSYHTLQSTCYPICVHGKDYVITLIFQMKKLGLRKAFIQGHTALSSDSGSGGLAFLEALVWAWRKVEQVPRGCVCTWVCREPQKQAGRSPDCCLSRVPWTP